jgi:chromosome segregation ATPase
VLREKAASWYHWEAEVVSVRAQNRQVRAELEEARSWRGQAEERAREAEQKAKEAEELKSALTAKVAAVVAAEEQLRQERAARQEAEGKLSRSGPLLLMPGRRSSGSILLSRERRRRWRSGRPRSRSSTGS